MSINLLESIQSLFPKDFITKTASILDEKPDYVKNGISGIIPSVLTGLMQKGTTAEGMAMIAQHDAKKKSSDSRKPQGIMAISRLI